MRAPEPTEIRDHLHQVLSRSEFLRKKSLWTRFWEWVGSHFPKVGGTAGAWGGVGSVLQWLLLAVLIAGVLVLAWWVVRNGVRGPRVEKPAEIAGETETWKTGDQWGTAAEGFEARSEWKDAMRCRYNELVSRLVDRGDAPATRGRTTGELRLDVTRSLPDGAAEFSEATLLFELPWYGDRPTGPAENQRFRDLAAAVVATRSANELESALATAEGEAP